MATVRYLAGLAVRLSALCGFTVLLAQGIGQSFFPADQIAFISSRSGTSHVYLLDARRRTEHLLSPLPVLECCLAWSPDGTRLALVSKSPDAGNTDIFLLDFAHHQQRQLTTANRADWMPVWSPDGQQLAFITYRDGNAELYVMSADGSNQSRRTQTARYELAPQWSVDGNKVVVVSALNDAPASYLSIPAGLYVTESICINDCTANLQPLLDPAIPLTVTESFRLLPRGQVITAAFNQNQAGGYGIYTLSSDARHPPERLTINSDLNPPSITNMGQIAAFISGDIDTTTFSRQKHVYVLDTGCIGTSDGCRPKLLRVAQAVGMDSGLSLSADGRWVVFAANWSGSPELYRARTDGSQLEQLTWNKTVEVAPAWRPG